MSGKFLNRHYESTDGNRPRVSESQLKNSPAFSLYTGRKKVEAAITAAMVGDTSYLSKLLTERGCVNYVSVDERVKESRKSLLMLAASCGQVGVVRLLLHHGAQINATCNLERTALMWACLRGEVGAARALLEAGADVNKMDRSSHTALTMTADHVGENEGCVDCFLLLREWGADISCCTRLGQTPLLLAAKHPEAHNLLRNLLEDDPDGVWFSSHERHMAMINAIEIGAEENLSVLLAAGCNPNYLTSSGVHVLNIAASHSFSCTHRLVASGAVFMMSQPYISHSLGVHHTELSDVKQADCNFFLSPVDVAILYGKFPIAKFLFTKCHMPPTYVNFDRHLCHENPFNTFFLVLSTIYKVAEQNRPWLGLISDFAPEPRRLMHLCLETVSCILGPVDRCRKLEQCELPRTVCNAISMDFVSEEEFQNLSIVNTMTEALDKENR
ncbi:ankyrin repeat and KH domain-containing protein mask isoform X2 [Aplysia californica]|uniref:Ankyrin repeat and KH domain-containing protein mask isoform X2 n=1 Tax=Aplysia californica TaxID=6500 RepID=A0ABM0JTM5_APLCA|nr:ankyrin repeat and KH domain-containing protein mask isoform X2 [Aplysia californica]